MVNMNGVELQSMTFNGVEVQTWTHDGVEVYSGKTQLKYTFRNYSDAGGMLYMNINVYDYETDELLKTVTLNHSTSPNYADECVTVDYGILGLSTRWTITLLVEGNVSADKLVNYGSSYGGTDNQIIPYHSDTVVTFITTGKYKL